MKKRLLILDFCLILVLGTMVFITSCTSSAKTPTTAAAPMTTVTTAPTTTTAPAPTTTVTTAPTTTTMPTKTATKTLKIGVVDWLGQGSGFEALRQYELLAELDNQKGGINVGGEPYLIKIVAYDCNMNQATSVSAVNRLVYEDGVKFIISGGFSYESAWFSVTEANKVLVSGGSFAQEEMNPSLHYAFNPTCMNSNMIISAGWFCKNYPEISKNIVFVAPESQMGHAMEVVVEQVIEKFGGKGTWLFYPPDSQDLSAVATKVKTLNAPAMNPSTGDPIKAGLLFKALRASGWKGQTIGLGAGNPVQLLTVCPAEALEGDISGAWPIYFDPPPTQAAKDFLAAYIAKYGKYEGEQPSDSAYSCIITALKQANTIDTDKVADVIMNGLKWECGSGSFQMISRPDIGNNRTVDSVVGLCMSQFKNGKPTILTMVSLEEALGYVQTIYGNVK